MNSKQEQYTQGAYGMSKKLNELGGLVEEIVREKSPSLNERYAGGVLTDEDDIKLVRQVATRRFVELGKIPASKVDNEGILIHDELLPISTFFGIYDQAGELQATTRLLWSNSITIDELRLPLDKVKPGPSQYLSSRNPGTIAEIGSLTKANKGVSGVALLKLLRGVWNFAGEHGIETFVCGLEPSAYPRFKERFGDALTRLCGDDVQVEFPGIHGGQIPLMIDVWEAVENQDNSKHRSPLERWQRRLIGNFIMRDMPHYEQFRKVS